VSRRAGTLGRAATGRAGAAARWLRLAGLLLLATTGALVYLAAVAPPALADNCGTLADCFAVASAMANAASAAATIAPIAMAAGAAGAASGAGAGTTAAAASSASAPGAAAPGTRPAAAAGANAAAQARVVTALGQAPIVAPPPPAATTPAPAATTAAATAATAAVPAPPPTRAASTSGPATTSSGGAGTAPGAGSGRPPAPPPDEAPGAAVPGAPRAVRALEDVVPPELAEDPQFAELWRPGRGTNVMVAVEVPAVVEGRDTTVRQVAPVRQGVPGHHGEDVALRNGDLRWGVQQALQAGTPDRPAVVRVLVNRTPCTSCAPLLATHLTVITSQFTPEQLASVRVELLASGAYEATEEIAEDGRPLHTARAEGFTDLATTTRSIRLLLESGWDARAMTRGGVLSERGEWFAGAVDHMRDYLGLGSADAIPAPAVPATAGLAVSAPPPQGQFAAASGGQPAVLPPGQVGAGVGGGPVTLPPGQMAVPHGQPVDPPLNQIGPILRGEPVVPPVEQIGSILRGETVVPPVDQLGPIARAGSSGAPMAPPGPQAGSAAPHGALAAPTDPGVVQLAAPSPEAARAALDAVRALARHAADLVASPGAGVPAAGMPHPVLGAAFQATTMAYEAASGAHRAYAAAYQAAQEASRLGGPAAATAQQEAQTTHTLSRHVNSEYQAALGAGAAAEQGGPNAAQHAVAAVAHAERATFGLVQATDASGRAVTAAHQAARGAAAPAAAPGVAEAAPPAQPARSTMPAAPFAGPGGRAAGPSGGADSARAARAAEPAPARGSAGPVGPPPPGPPAQAAPQPAGEPDPRADVQAAGRIVAEASATTSSITAQVEQLASAAAAARSAAPGASEADLRQSAAALVRLTDRAAVAAWDAARAADRAAQTVEDATARPRGDRASDQTIGPIPPSAVADVAATARSAREHAASATESHATAQRFAELIPPSPAQADEVMGHARSAAHQAERATQVAAHAIRMAGDALAGVGTTGPSGAATSGQPPPGWLTGGPAAAPADARGAGADAPLWPAAPGRPPATMPGTRPGPSSAVPAAEPPQSGRDPVGSGLVDPSRAFPILAGDVVFDRLQEGNPEQGRAAVRQKIADLVEHRTYGRGFTVQVTSVTIRPGSTQFGVDIFYGGRNVGQSRSTLTREGDTLFVTLDLITLDAGNLRHHGFGTAWTSHLEGWYRASGVDHIRLHATRAGTYVWARLGFTWVREADARAILQDLGSLLDEPDLTPREVAAAQAILDRAARFPWGDERFPTIAEIADIGRLEREPGRNHLGLRALTRGWLGRKYLR
jgi:hypothetical protein